MILNERTAKPHRARFSLLWVALATLGALAVSFAQTASRAGGDGTAAKVPARVAAAQRFLAQRGWRPGMRRPRTRIGQMGVRTQAAVQAQGSGTTNTWTPLGPMAVETTPYGLVSGRVSTIALDPSDATGGQLFVGTTGGGVWFANNAQAADLSTISFVPLTDSLSAFGSSLDTSISIGALTVQPGGTGVILAGTGDPNDALDSYYGAGILRSADHGQTWNLIAASSDFASGDASQNFSFSGEGFAGFAWSGKDQPQLVVAAVSQAYEGEQVDAVNAGYSTQGLYYSDDSGASWHLACISDGPACSPGSGTDVQGPLDEFPKPDGNAATAVVWNNVRGIFIAAVRYHGYYQSTDGMNWTRMSPQPGTTLTTCPTDTGYVQADGCPIFRGALAVNPVTGDTFAWTVDANNQDQGLYEDQCLPAGGPCASGFTWQQWDTQALESDTLDGAATIANGTYSLTLAAVPISTQETMFWPGPMTFGRRRVHCRRERRARGATQPIRARA